MARTVRNLGGRPGVGLSVAAGTLGGISQAAGTLGAVFDRKEERERRKPLEDLQLREQTARTKGLEGELKAKEEQKERVDFTRDEISNLMQTELFFDKEDADAIADEIDSAPVSNKAAMEVIQEPELFNNLKTQEGSQKVLDEMPEDIKSQLNIIKSEAKKPIDDLGVPSAKEIEEGGTIPPGAPAPKPPKQAIFRPDDTGELKKVEPEQPEEVPIEIRRKEALLEKYDELQARDIPEFENTIASLEKDIGEYYSGKAAAAAAKEKERIRLENRSFEERKLETDVEQKELDREAKAEEARLRRAFDRERDALKAAAKKSNKNFTKDQSEAATFAIRSENAERVFEELADKGFNPATFKNRIVQKGNISAIKDPDQRRYAQAVRDYINLTLRRESGAAISDSEFTNALKQYFSSLGDDEATQAQMKQNRLANQAGLRTQAGEALDVVRTTFDELMKKENEKGKKKSPVLKQNEVVMVDAKGNRAVVQIDKDGNAVKVVREL